MEYSIETLPFDKVQTECIVVGIYQDQQLTPSATTVDGLLQGIISKVIERGDISGKNSETLLINPILDNSIERILLVGLGNKDKITRKLYRKALVSAITTIKATKIKSACCALTDTDVADSDEQWKTRQIVEIFNDTIYQYQETKTSQESKLSLNTIQIKVEPDAKSFAESGLKQGIAIAKGVLFDFFMVFPV